MVKLIYYPHQNLLLLQNDPLYPGPQSMPQSPVILLQGVSLMHFPHIYTQFLPNCPSSHSATVKSQYYTIDYYTDSVKYSNFIGIRLLDLLILDGHEKSANNFLVN